MLEVEHLCFLFVLAAFCPLTMSHLLGVSPSVNPATSSDPPMSSCLSLQALCDPTFQKHGQAFSEKVELKVKALDLSKNNGQLVMLPNLVMQR
jgi:hypothetical protein